MQRPLYFLDTWNDYLKRTKTKQQCPFKVPQPYWIELWGFLLQPTAVTYSFRFLILSQKHQNKRNRIFLKSPHFLLLMRNLHINKRKKSCDRSFLKDTEFFLECVFILISDLFLFVTVRLQIIYLYHVEPDTWACQTREFDPLKLELWMPMNNHLGVRNQWKISFASTIFYNYYQMIFYQVIFFRNNMSGVLFCFSF